MTAEKVLKILRANQENSITITIAADTIESLLSIVNRIHDLPNCHDCGSQKDCKYVPAWGETVRYNCPLYTSKDLTNNSHRNVSEG